MNLILMTRLLPLLRVAPRAGAWIETTEHLVEPGFKRVAPRAGAWIETRHQPNLLLQATVAPRAGAWIETREREGIREQRGRPPCGGVD